MSITSHDLNTMATAAMEPDADATTLLVCADAFEDAGQDGAARQIREKVAMGRHPFTDLRLGMTLVSLPGGYRRRGKLRVALIEAGIPLSFTYYDRQKAIYYIPTDRLAEARRLGVTRCRLNDRRV